VTDSDLRLLYSKFTKYDQEVRQTLGRYRHLNGHTLIAHTLVL